MVVALGVLVVLSLPALWVLVAQPVPRRLALRYPMRRPVEAVLVVLGTLLGTSIITGSLIVGDTIDRSIRAAAYDQLGPIDELVTVNGITEGAALAARFTAFEAPSIDGVLGFVTVPVAVVGEATQPRAQLLEVDFAAAAEFGPDPDIVGIGGPTPPPGHAVITDDLARRAQLAVGDTLTVYAYGLEVPFVVDRVVGRRGVAGFWTLDPRQQSYNVLVGPGTVASLAAGLDGVASAGFAEPPAFNLAFSNVGGVEDGAERTDEAMAAIEERLGDGGFARPVKRDQLAVATDAAASLTQLYFTMGMFAVAAGVLLVVNIFVMLADDRRSELGMLRAVGFRRRPLVAAFATEGWLYSLAAGAVGSLVGIGFGWVIAWRADRILSSGTDLNSLALTFSFNWSTVVTGFSVGFAISLATIVATSVRTSRMNIIAAIRDLPATPIRRVHRRWSAIGALGVVVGVLWTLAATLRTDGYGVAMGPMLALLGLGPILARTLGVRPVVTFIAVAQLVWGTLFVAVLSALDIDVGIPLFLVQGLSMAGAAVALVTTYQAAIGHGLAKVLRGALPVRLGLAYPIARRWRTAMTLAMFAIIILTLVYLAIIAAMFRNQVDTIASDLSGGFGVVVTSNPTDPLRAAQLEGFDGVEAVAPLSYGIGLFEVGEDPAKNWPMTGFGAELAAAPPALKDRGRYGSDAEAWAAVLADPSLVIIDELFLTAGGGPPTGVPRPGDQITIGDSISGRTRPVTIAAWAENDLLLNGVFYGQPGVDELTAGRAVPTRFFVRAEDDGAALAQRLRTEFVANGADAEAVVDTVRNVLAQQNGFFTLMQQFVGVGLIVAICGIGVIMVRAVRERRRTVGVLRSLGFQPAAVGRAFLVEAAFVAVEGVVIGVLVALIGSRGLVASGSNFVAGMRWTVPWGEVGVIVAIALVASAATALWPARRASRIEPADALRMTD